ncbi:hypothetical protein TRFO_11078 [Tritrichomonas foetus]|uniref:Uncharacterized protein n=1 Tax=Tritrichomonas foetus TaxID=1144522 RepID=A0A1J4J9Z6_9EUKA|nr:hypothetical protein TRFO_11078 [Tritrichomonas foetus]|eukprot:OHS94467.1 hypothetical protein TRFO_11078 [Tritrichomonas foetus]
MIDYTKEPEYDLRKLPCGGWKSSQISVRSHGRWLQFSDPDSKDKINKTLPIDYSKKYVPPKRKTQRAKKENMPEEEEGIESMINEFGFVKNDLNSARSIQAATSVYVPPIELTPETLTGFSTSEHFSNINNTSRVNSMNSTRLNSGNSSRVNSVRTPKSNRPERSRRPNSPRDDEFCSMTSRASTRTVKFDDSFIPQTERVVRKCRGSTQRNPFHVSNEVRQRNLNSARQRPKTEMKTKTEMKSKNRPKTEIWCDRNDSSIDIRRKPGNMIQNENELIVFGSRPKTSFR